MVKWGQLNQSRLASVESASQALTPTVSKHGQGWRDCNIRSPYVQTLGDFLQKGVLQ